MSKRKSSYAKTMKMLGRFGGPLVQGPLMKRDSGFFFVRIRERRPGQFDRK